MPPPEDTLFCAYQETRVPTYHLSSSPANILRMEKTSICDVISTPKPHHSIYKKESFRFHSAELNTWVGGMEENRRALHCLPLGPEQKVREARVRAARALGNQAGTEGPHSVVKGSLPS